MDRVKFLERRLEPSSSKLTVAGLTFVSVFAAMLIGALLFLPFDADPLQAYQSMFRESFAETRGFGFTLVKATPLIFIGLGTVVAWRSGFFYLGFEGTLLIGAAAAAWFALLTRPGSAIGPLPQGVFFPLVFAFSFAAGGLWASLVGLLKARFGGNEVLLSLMTNYVALFLIQYLVSEPLRAPGDLPQTARIPEETVLPFIIPDTRAHAGILVALGASVVVWLILTRTPLGYQLVAAGHSPRAARYGGINVGRSHLLAAFLAGGLGAWAGLAQVLGVQFRLLDGMAQGTGFVGIVTALLGKLHPLGVTVAAVLYAGMGVGADAMQRQAGLPSSIILIVQSLIVLLILASDMLRYYRLRLFGHQGELPTSQEVQTGPIRGN